MFKILVYKFETKELVEIFGVKYSLEEAIDAQWGIDLKQWDFTVYFSIEKMEA